MDKETKRAILAQFKEEPFGKKLGIHLVEVNEGFARVEMCFTKEMENMFGMAHGGAIFSLMDAAFEVASNSHGTMAVALSMNINYLASPAGGARLSAEAKEINKTKFEKELADVYGNSVTSLKLGNIGGDLDLHFARVTSPNKRLTLKRILVAQPDGTFIMKEDVSFNFIKVKD